MTATRLQKSNSQREPVIEPTAISLRQREAERAALDDYLNHQLAPSTARAYRSDWQQFQTWCQQRQLTALPAAPETIALFLASQAGDDIKVSTLERRLAAIRLAHDVAGHLLPTSQALLNKSECASI